MLPKQNTRPGADQTHLVAVYGTLKSGFHNNLLLDGAEFLGEVKTVDKYPLVIDGLPYLMERRGEGRLVFCELYRVSQGQLDRLDRLEGHPHFYRRAQIFVANGDGNWLAWVYFLARDEARLKNRPTHEKYLGAHPAYARR